MSSEATEALIAQLDAVDDSPGAAALRARSYELLRAGRGGLVVDVGCGAGRAVAELADQDLPVLGIDVSDQMIALARGRWPHGQFRVGDAYALPLEDGRPRATGPTRSSTRWLTRDGRWPRPGACWPRPAASSCADRTGTRS